MVKDRESPGLLVKNPMKSQYLLVTIPFLLDKIPFLLDKIQLLLVKLPFFHGKVPWWWDLCPGGQHFEVPIYVSLLLGALESLISWLRFLVENPFSYWCWTQGMDGLLGVAGTIISYCGSFPHSLRLAPVSFNMDWLYAEKSRWWFYYMWEKTIVSIYQFYVGKIVFHNGKSLDDYRIICRSMIKLQINRRLNPIDQVDD